MDKVPILASTWTRSRTQGTSPLSWRRTGRCWWWSPWGQCCCWPSCCTQCWHWQGQSLFPGPPGQLYFRGRFPFVQTARLIAWSLPWLWNRSHVQLLIMCCWEQGTTRWPWKWMEVKEGRGTSFKDLAERLWPTEIVVVETKGRQQSYLNPTR